jgi:hypothetical protein
MNIDPFALATVEMLVQCSEISQGQMADLDKFLSSNKSRIQDSLVAGLESENGALIALKLLKLQSDRLQALTNITSARIRTQKPVEESRFLLAVVGQVFHTLAEWMRINSVDRITVDSLPDLQEFVLNELVIQNGYRSLVVKDESH